MKQSRNVLLPRSRGPLAARRILTFAGLLLSGVAAAEDAGGAPADLRYVELKPTFVTNFGPSEGRRLMYVKTDVAVRVEGQEAEEHAIYHLPALRNELVMLLSRQSEQSLASGAGREEVRMAALAALNEVLVQETGQAGLQDLMFTNFLVQR